MSDKKDDKSFWTTLPGILTGCAALLTAIGTLVTALYAAGLLQALFPAAPTVVSPTVISMRPTGTVLPPTPVPPTPVPTTPAPPKATNTSTKPAPIAKNVDFARGSKILEGIQLSKWPTVSNQYGHVGPDSPFYYVLEATSNTWMGPGSLMPINNLTGDFIIDIGFKVAQTEDCSLDITLSDYDTNYSRLDLFYDIWRSSPQTFSIYEEWVENRFYVHTVTRFAERTAVPFDSSFVDWTNENKLSVKREGSTMGFYLDGNLLQSFQPSQFTVKQIGISIAFKSRVLLTNIVTKVPQ